MAYNETTLRIFIEQAPVAIAMFDLRMRYIAASRRWREDYGLGKRELVGHSHYDIFPEIPARWRQVHSRGLAGEVVRENLDVFPRADGSQQWLRWEVRPWRHESGSIGGIVIFTEDLSDIHRMQQALVKSAGEIRELAAIALLAREQEKARVAHELHEGLAQVLAGLAIETAALRDQLPADAAAARQRLAAIRDHVTAAVQETRRIASGLRPVELGDLGVAAAMRKLVSDFGERTGVRCELIVEPADFELAEPQATAVFRIAQEALENVARHAGASHATVELRASAQGQVCIAVSDDGRGFDAAQGRKPDALGLAGVQERAIVLDGQMTLQSSPGAGTRVEVCVPVPRAG